MIEDGLPSRIVDNVIVKSVALLYWDLTGWRDCNNILNRSLCCEEVLCSGCWLHGGRISGIWSHQEAAMTKAAVHAASGPLIENVVPRVGCNGNTAEEEEKKEEKVRKTSLLPNKFLCAMKTNLVRTCVEMFVEIV